jgi:hypothetical protein
MHSKRRDLWALGWLAVMITDHGNYKKMPTAPQRIYQFHVGFDGHQFDGLDALVDSRKPEDIQAGSCHTGSAGQQRF